MMKDSKAVGTSGIAAEMIKAAGDIGLDIQTDCRWLHIFVWNSLYMYMKVTVLVMDFVLNFNAQCTGIWTIYG